MEPEPIIGKRRAAAKPIAPLVVPLVIPLRHALLEERIDAFGCVIFTHIAGHHLARVVVCRLVARFKPAIEGLLTNPDPLGGFGRNRRSSEDIRRKDPDERLPGPGAAAGPPRRDIYPVSYMNRQG